MLFHAVVVENDKHRIDLPLVGLSLIEVALRACPKLTENEMRELTFAFGPNQGAYGYFYSNLENKHSSLPSHHESLSS